MLLPWFYWLLLHWMHCVALALRSGSALGLMRRCHQQKTSWIPSASYRQFNDFLQHLSHGSLLLPLSAHPLSPTSPPSTPSTMWDPFYFLRTGLLLISCCLRQMKMDQFFPQGNGRVIPLAGCLFFGSRPCRDFYRYGPSAMGWNGMSEGEDSLKI